MYEGRLLSGRYRLLSKMGQGGMGSVWRAEHLALQTVAVVKLMDPSIAENAEALSRFKREAQAAAELRSAHVVQILDYGVDDGLPYIVMELLNGESLAERLDCVGRLEASDTAEILLQVAKAIERAHERQIVHRDLKPDNIFLTRDGDDVIVKVLDFGIAKSRRDSATGFATQTGTILGTPYYMSPEQTVGQRAVDHRTDIWAFAVIAVECITGVRPFDGDTVGAVAVAICAGRIPKPSELGRVPAGLDDWFARCTERDPDKRTQSIWDAAVDLKEICSKEPTPVDGRTVPAIYAGATPADDPRGACAPSETPDAGVSARIETGSAFSGTAPGLRHGAHASMGVLVLSGAAVVVVATGVVASVLMRDTPQPGGVVGGQPTAAQSRVVEVRRAQKTRQPLATPSPVPSPVPAPSVSASAPPADSKVQHARPPLADTPRPRQRERTQRHAPTANPVPPAASGDSLSPKPTPTLENLDDLIAL